MLLKPSRDDVQVNKKNVVYDNVVIDNIVFPSR